MIKKWYSTATFGGKISLGKAGEGEAVQLKIDVSEWLSAYPGAQVKLFVTPPKPLNPYFAALEGPEGGEVLWTIRKADTQQAGSGTLELLLLQDEDKLIKSATASTVIASSPSASSAAGDAPETHPTWWEGALEKIGEAEEQALTNVEAAKNAAVGAVEGKFDAEVAAGKAAVQAAGSAQTQAVNQAGAAQQSAIENKGANTLASIPEDYTAIDADVKALKDFKADAIWDTSARAASHELHAQRGPMSVTLFGKTTETGTGDKSPDNPYVISGVDAAQVRAGSRNLIKQPYYDSDSTKNGVTFKVNADGSITANGTATAETYFNIASDYAEPKLDIISGADYFMSGCPSGGSSASYLLCYQSNGSYNDYGSGTIIRRSLTAAKNRIFIIIRAGVTVSNLTFKPMVNVGSTPTAYEPYIANTLDLPLLPDGKPLMGNGTVDDIVENDVLSGCDKKIVLDGTQAINKYPATAYPNLFFIRNLAEPKSKVYTPTLPYFAVIGENAGVNVDSSGSLLFSVGQCTTVDEIKAYLAANPLTVFYRSTEYTPDKDIRVCRVQRGSKTIEIKGDRTAETWAFDSWGNTHSRAYIANVVPAKSWDAIIACNIFDTTSSGWSENEAGVRFMPGYLNILQFLKSNEEWAALGVTDTASAAAYFASLYNAGKPVTVSYLLSTLKVYMTDRRILRKPDSLTTDTTTVTGSGETAVEYPHKTKHYIDSQIAAAVALALNG